MSLSIRTLTRTLLLTLVTALPLFAEPASVTIEGRVLRPTSITLESARQNWPSEVAPLEYVLKGRTESGFAVKLVKILESVGIDSGPNKGDSLRLAVLAVGSDQYVAVFSLGELLPDFGNRDVYLVWSEDGENLRVISLHEAKAGRSVYKLVKLEVQQLDPR